MVLFTLDTAFLHERQREPLDGHGSGRLAWALRSSGEQAGRAGIPSCGYRSLGKRVKSENNGLGSPIQLRVLGPAKGVGRVLSFLH